MASEDDTAKLRRLEAELAQVELEILRLRRELDALPLRGLALRRRWEKFRRRPISAANQLAKV